MDWYELEPAERALIDEMDAALLALLAQRFGPLLPPPNAVQLDQAIAALAHRRVAALTMTLRRRGLTGEYAYSAGHLTAAASPA